MIGLSPFLPNDTPVGSLATLLPLLAGGFAFGQAIHTIGVYIERSSKESKKLNEEIQEKNSRISKNVLRLRKWLLAVPAGQLFGSEYFLDTSHRTLFCEELTRNNESENKDGLIDADLLDGFYHICKSDIPDLNLPEKRTKLGAECDFLYSTIRSLTHIDGRGRSQTFQSVYAFCRSMWITSLALFIVYSAYVILKIGGIASSMVGYTSFIGSLDISNEIIFLTSIVVTLSSFKIFTRAKSDYQKNFVQYLFSDFITLQNREFQTQQVIDVSVGDNDQGE